MMVLRRAVVVAGVVVVVSVASGNPSSILAAENAQVGAATALVQPVAVTHEVSGDASGAVVKVKKKRKKARAPEPESLPGQRLSLKQVMTILATTRNLSGRNLSGLTLVGFDLSRCNLKGTDLNHANLERADLGESNLERSDLTGANLKMASLRLAGMAAVKLDNANLTGAIWKDSRVCAPDSVGRCRDILSSSP